MLGLRQSNFLKTAFIDDGPRQAYWAHTRPPLSDLSFTAPSEGGILPSPPQGCLPARASYSARAAALRTAAASGLASAGPPRPEGCTLQDCVELFISAQESAVQLSTGPHAATCVATWVHAPRSTR